jgi:tetratricopeptide (TPR) repeat protein
MKKVLFIFLLLIQYAFGLSIDIDGDMKQDFIEIKYLENDEYIISYLITDKIKKQTFRVYDSNDEEARGTGYGFSIYMGIRSDELCLENHNGSAQKYYSIECYIYDSKNDDWIHHQDINGTYYSIEDNYKIIDDFKYSTPTLYNSLKYDFKSYLNIDNSLENIKIISFMDKLLLMKNKISINPINLLYLTKKIPLETKNLQKYNDIAYYLQQANANNEAIFLLEKIIEKYPNRIVAYLNLADAYAGINNKEKAKENYEKYISLMKQDNKENKILKRVLAYK